MAATGIPIAKGLKTSIKCHIRSVHFEGRVRFSCCCAASHDDDDKSSGDCSATAAIKIKVPSMFVL